MPQNTRFPKLKTKLKTKLKSSAPKKKSGPPSRVRATAWLLLVAFLVTFLPLEGMGPLGLTAAHADGRPTLTITRTYENLQPSKSTIGVQEDTRLIGMTNHLFQVTLSDTTSRTVNHTIPPTPISIGGDIPWEWNVRSATVSGQVDAAQRTLIFTGIVEENIPSIDEIARDVVETGETIELRGPGIGGIDFTNPAYSLRLGNSIVPVGNIDQPNPNTIIISGSYPRGVYDISIVYRDLKSPTQFDGGTITDTSQYWLELSHTYTKAVTIIRKLELDNIEMFPTIGRRNTIVEFSRNESTPLTEYDVYFIENVNDPTEYNPNNIAISQGPPLVNNGVWSYRVQLPPGVREGRSYAVVFTRPGDKLSRFELPQRFRVIGIQEAPTIESSFPASASTRQPTEVEIEGSFWTRLSVPGLKYNVVDIEPAALPSEPWQIKYVGSGTFDAGGIDGEQTVTKVTREFRVDIGAPLPIQSFQYYHTADPSNPPDPTVDPNDGQRAGNVLKVTTPIFPDDQAGPKAIVLEITTVITLDIGGGDTRDLTLRDIVTRTPGVVYVPSTEAPEVTEVIPSIIPLNTPIGGGENRIHASLEVMQMVIRGDNFLVTRFGSGTDEQVLYPQLRIGGTVIDPSLAPGQRVGNAFGPLTYEVLRGNTVVDGKGSNEKGDTILFTLPTGDGGFPVITPNDRNLGIKNPLRNSLEYPLTFSIFEDRLDFLFINTNLFPEITSVTPNLVAMTGNVPVTIEGSNFHPDAMIYIGGEPVTNITQRTAETIEIIAPPGRRPGEVQLQVINPEGGIATHPFTYTETGFAPNLTSLAPNLGTEGTLVVLRGSGFQRPDRSVVLDDINVIEARLMTRLLGTRVLVGGHDINSYHRGAGGRIGITPYYSPVRSVPEPVFVYEPELDIWRPGAGMDSVLFLEYSGDTPVTPTPVYRLVRDEVNQYYLQGTQLDHRVRYNRTTNSFEGVQGNNVNPITLEADGVLTINGIQLRAYTPYAIQPRSTPQGTRDFIIGNRAKVLGNNTIHARIPNMSVEPWAGQGTYDVTAINPDTQQSTLRNAFTYFAEPVRIPAVADIIPEQGPDRGGNLITLVLDENVNRAAFVDTGSTKTRVYIDGREVPASQVTVSPDGKQIRLTVPAYVGELQEQGGKLTVPVVLVNPDGGSFSIDQDNPITVKRSNGSNGEQSVELRGYTYVVPASNPRIDRIIPNQGSAAGGYTVEIFGFDFRDFVRVRDEEGNLVDELTADPTQKQPSRYNSEFEVLTDPLYPEVYFGTQRAEVVEFDSEYLRVVVGPNSGTVPVYVVNKDAGISNTQNFTFDSSAPVISSVNPPKGDRRGGVSVEVRGQGFETGMVTLLKESYTSADDNAPSERLQQSLTQVRVGARTNKDLPREHENSGAIRSNRVTVTLPGDFRVEYNTQEGGVLTASIRDQGVTYRHEYRGFGDGETLYLDTSHLKATVDGVQVSYPYGELVKVSLGDRRLLVEMGYAPKVEHITNSHLRVTMPAYFTTGKVRLSVINPDGGTANAEFEYVTPDSKPVITNITRENREPIRETRDGMGEILVQKVSHRGGNIMSIIGVDFREENTISIGDLVTMGPDHPNRIDEALPNRITFEMPPLPEAAVGNLYRVVVANFDGGTANSEEARYKGEESIAIYIEIIKGESNPRLDTITPAEGPVTGGTRITLKGMDFREEMEGFPGVLSVLFGESIVENGSGNLEYVDYREIKVTAPASSRWGNVKVRVENPDGELSLPPADFTYISQPTIETINPPRIFANDQEGDVTVTGTMFMPGAKVILGGRLVRRGQAPPGETTHGDGLRGVDDDGNNLYFTVVGGVPASSVSVTSENVMVLRFPEVLDLKSDDLIIINPDGGLSDPFDDFDYAIPVPDKPLVLEAIPGAESSVHLVWSKSGAEVLNAAKSYEVYGKRSIESQYAFIGNTEEADFLVRGLEPDTRYDFMVRALNEYGSAIEFAEVEVRTFSLREDPKLKEKVEELDRQQEALDTRGKEEVVGHQVIRTVGSREIGTGNTPYVFDFSGAAYSRQNEFILAFPVSSLATTTRPITLTDGGATLTISPSQLLTRDVAALGAVEVRDAVVMIHLTRLEGQAAAGLTSALSRTQRQASAPYQINYTLRTPSGRQDLPRLLGNATLTIRYDANTYGGANNAAFMQYDPSTHRFSPAGSSSRDPGTFQLIGNR